MLIITKVETINVDKNYGDMLHHLVELKHNREPFVLGEDVIAVETMIELIKGQRYVDTQRGIDVVIGCTQDAKEALLMQYRLWKINEEKQSRDLEKLNSEKEAIETHHKIVSADLKATNSKVERVIAAPFLTRLKWLFTGVKV